MIEAPQFQSAAVSFCGERFEEGRNRNSWRRKKIKEKFSIDVTRV